MAAAGVVWDGGVEADPEGSDGLHRGDGEREGHSGDAVGNVCEINGPAYADAGAQFRSGNCRPVDGQVQARGVLSDRLEGVIGEREGVGCISANVESVEVGFEVESVDGYVTLRIYAKLDLAAWEGRIDDKRAGLHKIGRFGAFWLNSMRTLPCIGKFRDHPPGACRDQGSRG